MGTERVKTTSERNLKRYFPKLLILITHTHTHTYIYIYLVYCLAQHGGDTLLGS